MYWATKAWLTCTLFLSGISAVQAIPMLTVVSNSALVTQGSNARFDVLVSGLDEELIGAYDLNLAFDSSRLSLTSVTFDTFLDGPADSISGFETPLGGTLSVFEVSLSGLSNQLGLSQFRLFSLDFLTLQEGLASIGLTGGVISNEAGGSYLGWSTQGADVRILAEEPPPTSVPAPASLGLLLTGFAGSLFYRRKAVKQRSK